MRAVVKRVVEDLAGINASVSSLYDEAPSGGGGGRGGGADKSSDSSANRLLIGRRPPAPALSGWSATPSTLGNSLLHRLFSDKVDLLGPAEFGRASVVSGIATLTQTMEDGRRQMVGLLLPSDFVGRPGRETAPYDVVATTDLVMCCFRKKPFEELMARTPHIAHRLLEMTLDELDAAREWMLVLGRKTAREKIASLLSIIARRDASLAKVRINDEMAFDLPLTREAMADYLGLTLETVSRQMSALKRDGVIELKSKRHIVIPDMQRLMDEAGDDSDGGLPA